MRGIIFLNTSLSAKAFHGMNVKFYATCEFSSGPLLSEMYAAFHSLPPILRKGHARVHRGFR